MVGGCCGKNNDLLWLLKQGIVTLGDGLISFGLDWIGLFRECARSRDCLGRVHQPDWYLLRLTSTQLEHVFYMIHSLVDSIIPIDRLGIYFYDNLLVLETTRPKGLSLMISDRRRYRWSGWRPGMVCMHVIFPRPSLDCITNPLWL